MSTGGGFTRLNSTLALMDVPGMQKRMYTDAEEFLGNESHVFGDHTNCSRDFCTFQQNASVPDDEGDEEEQLQSRPLKNRLTP